MRLDRRSFEAAAFVALLLLAGYGLGTGARYLCLVHVAPWFVGDDLIDRIFFCRTGWGD